MSLVDAAGKESPVPTTSTRDCPRCHGRHTLSARARPHGIHVTHWACVRCGFRFDDQSPLR